MPAIWSEDNTIGSALGSIGNTVMQGPMIRLRTMETMSALRQRALEYQRMKQQYDLQNQIGADAMGDIMGAVDGGTNADGTPVQGVDSGQAPPAVGPGAGQAPSSSSQDATFGAPAVGATFQPPGVPQRNTAAPLTPGTSQQPIRTSGTSDAGTAGAADPTLATPLTPPGFTGSVPGPSASAFAPPTPQASQPQPAQSPLAQSGMLPREEQQKIAQHYGLLIQSAALAGNTQEVQRLKAEAIDVIRGNYGARNANEQLVFHNAYSDPKGATAVALAGALQNNVANGMPLTRGQAQFLNTYIGANAPVTTTGSAAEGTLSYQRGGMPVGQATIDAMKRQGVEVPLLPSSPGAPNVPPAVAGPGAPQAAAAPPPLQQQPQSTYIPPPGREFADAQKAKEQPEFRAAFNSFQAAQNVISSLQLAKQTNSATADQIALNFLGRTVAENVRVPGGIDPQDRSALYSRLQGLQMLSDEFFKNGRTLPDNVRSQIAALAMQAANNARQSYNQAFRSPDQLNAYSLQGMSSAGTGRLLNADVGVPQIPELPAYDVNFNWVQPKTPGSVAPPSAPATPATPATVAGPGGTPPAAAQPLPPVGLRPLDNMRRRLMPAQQ